MNTLKTKIRDELIDLGFPTNLAGYRCLMLAVPMYRSNPGQPVTKELYPEIGGLLTPRESGQQVEKQIRYAIAAAWERGRQENWAKLFPRDKRPTNSEFISRLTESVEEQLGENSDEM